MAETWATLKIHIRIRSSDIDVVWLENLLGLANTQFTNRGTQQTISGRRWPMLDTWEFELLEAETSDLAFGEILDLLKNRRSAFQEVRAAGLQLELYLSYHSSNASGGFQLPPDLLTFAGEAGLTLNVSILSWGGVPHK